MIHLMLRSLTFFCLITGLTCAAGQSPVSVPDVGPAYSGTAAPHDWHGQLPSFTLTPAAPGAPAGKIWVRKSEAGMVIAGQVEGASPDFPKSVAELMAKDHVEVWLAVVPNPVLPVLGWGNQFGDNELRQGETSCATEKNIAGDPPDQQDIQQCVEWVKRQKSYRTQLKRLFARQWQLAPGLGKEAFSVPAYQAIQQNFIGSDKEFSPEPPKELRPQESVPELKTKPAEHGYDFEILVPWKLFPPVNSTAPREFYLLVEVFAAAPPGKKTGAYATTSPGRRYADFAAFHRLTFENPRQYTISECAYPPMGLDFLSKPLPGYFFPGESAVVAHTFVLENYRAGYAYKPAGLSPVTRSTDFFSRELAPGEHLCGPALRHFKAGKGTDFTLAGEEGRHAVIVDKAGFDIHKLSSGTLLVRNGPQSSYSLFGSGQCGACPRVELQVYSIAADLRIKRLISIYDVIGNFIDDMDVQLSPDWERISVYRSHSEYASDEHPPGWDDEFYCLRQDTYQKCGVPAHNPPPEPRTIKIEEP